MTAIRILIVDDHEAVRQGVRSLLMAHAGWEVCGEAVDGWDAIQKAVTLKPDVVVLDTRMPKLDGLEAMPLIKRELPNSEILILTQYPSEMKAKVMEAGASGLVSKDNADRDLLPTIERLVQKWNT